MDQLNVIVQSTFAYSQDSSCTGDLLVQFYDDVMIVQELDDIRISLTEE